ncbi:hypothetical protein PG989_008405 [Apiospora arundinis]
MDQAPIVDAQAEPPKEPVVGSSSSPGEVDLRTGSSESGDELPLPPPDNGPKKGKQPEEYNPPQESPVEAEDTTTSAGTSGLSHSIVEEDSLPAPPPLQPGDPRWAYSPDRPPAKLPIYFHDAVGRNYTFPWEKAKTWEGMERLICACFVHVTPLAWYVNQRNYDLKVVESGAPEIPTAAGAAMAGVSSQVFTSAVAPPAPSLAAAYGSTGSSQQTPPLLDTPQQQPAAGSGAPYLQTVILPELWDELAVPGMSVTMLMWPKPSYHGTLPPPPPPLPQLPPPPPPPPPIIYPQYGGVPPGGVGRGYGRGGVPMGVGRGRGAASTRWSSPSRSPSPPPRRPKTRKQQGGGL